MILITRLPLSAVHNDLKKLSAEQKLVAEAVMTLQKQRETKISQKENLTDKLIKIRNSSTSFAQENVMYEGLLEKIEPAHKELDKGLKYNTGERDKLARRVERIKLLVDESTKYLFFRQAAFDALSSMKSNLDMKKEGLKGEVACIEGKIKIEEEKAARAQKEKEEHEREIEQMVAERGNKLKGAQNKKEEQRAVEQSLTVLQKSVQRLTTENKQKQEKLDRERERHSKDNEKIVEEMDGIANKIADLEKEIKDVEKREAKMNDKDIEEMKAGSAKRQQEIDALKKNVGDLETELMREEKEALSWEESTAILDQSIAANKAWMDEHEGPAKKLQKEREDRRVAKAKMEEQCNKMASEQAIQRQQSKQQVDKMTLNLAKASKDYHDAYAAISSGAPVKTFKETEEELAVSKATFTVATTLKVSTSGKGEIREAHTSGFLTQHTSPYQRYFFFSLPLTRPHRKSRSLPPTLKARRRRRWSTSGRRAAVAMSSRAKSTPSPRPSPAWWS